FYDIARAHYIRRYVHDLTIYHDVLVRYQLTCSRTSRGNTHTVNCIVQASFQQPDQVFTGSTFQARRLYISVTELLFQYTVSVFGFLLFFQLDSVFRSGFTLTRWSMLTRRIAVLLQVLARSENWFA